MATEALVSCVVADLYCIAKDGLSLLFGVKKEVDELSSTFSDIQAVLEDAESHQVTNERVRGWLWELKEVAYEVENILDEWVTDTNTTYKLQYDIGKRIRETTERLSEISIKKNRFNLREHNTREVMLVPNKEERQTGSLIDESEIFGRDDFKQSIIEQLVSETSQEEKSVSIVSIVGMGGLGKTTLAQLIYNDKRVMAHFEKNRIWVCVSDPFDVKRIAIKVIESMGGSTSNNPDLDTLQHSLREAIDKKRFLLVLDDVWDESGRLWQLLRVPLMGAAPGSKIVVTTRSRQVGKAMKTHHIHDLGVLSDSDCWKLFKSIAFEGAEDEDSQELIATGEKFVERCKGVPLAVKALGSLLRSRREKWYWEHILESEIWKWDIAKDDIPKDNGILPALLLSYYNLPSSLQRSFSFCSVFPKDHMIEKDELVKLWMSHGIIKSEKGKKDVIEEIGEMYFDHLLTRSLFQDAEKDIDGNVVRCKMHDLVHDLATFVSSGDYRNMEAGDSESCSIKCHHLLLLVNKDVSCIPSPLCSAKRLRTLLLRGSSTIKEVPHSLFNHLKFLRALDLRRSNIENLPSSLGKLKHLRYLDLSWLKITELPESVTDLCNLQTLKLNYCTRLCLLPSGMSKMVNLRHLEIEETDHLTVLPNGFGMLTSLRTLCKFPLGDENSGCKIGELKDLNLRGELSIENLESVVNGNDASEAELQNKSDLHVLSLSCNNKSKKEWTTLGNDEMKKMDSVLEGLRPPHSNLKELKIKNYAGSMFPSWLEDSRFSSLVRVVLENCRKCMLLPGLGKLHSLKYLEIIRADEVKVVGGEFYGNVDARGKETRFPKLEELYFKSMLNWKEWRLTQEFSCESLPSDRWGLLESLHTLKISICPELASLPDGLGQLSALQTLHIYGCQQLSSLPEGLGQLKALQTLDISHCQQLSSLPEGLGQLKALKTLDIVNCERLLSLPEGLGQLEALHAMVIHKCHELTSLLNGLGRFKALQNLEIENCNKLRFLSDGLLQLNALQILWVHGCPNLQSLLGAFTKSLCKLKICECPQLRPLPNLQCLTALKWLSIENCPLVTEQLEIENEEYWCKISCIPRIYIDGKRIQKGVEEMEI